MNNDSVTTPEQLTWHMTIQYDGKAFHGWQANLDERTVQHEIRWRLRQLFRQPDLQLYGTSRTDSGVHALDQHASFTTSADTPVSLEQLRYAMFRWLPEDISITNIEVCPNEFHARRSSHGKAYTYIIYHGQPRPNPMLLPSMWRLPKTLDVEKMRQAATYLVGTHDFTTFCNQGSFDPNPCKTLWNVDLVENGNFLYVSVVGNSFLYKMVRNIVGYLVSVGRGNFTPEMTKELLQKKERILLENTAPAHGLFLAKVFFSEDEYKTYSPILPPGFELKS